MRRCLFSEGPHESLERSKSLRNHCLWLCFWAGRVRPRSSASAGSGAEDAGHASAPHRIRAWGFVASREVKPCGYKARLGVDLTSGSRSQRGEGAGDAHLPYIHFFSFDFFVEILQNQIATLLRNPFYKKCDMHVKNSWFFKWCRMQPKWDPALGIRTILIRCKTISHFFLGGEGNSNDYISYT